MNPSQLSVLTLAIFVVGVIASGVTAYLVPHIPAVWQASLGVAVAALLAHLYFAKKTYSDVFAKRTTRYGLNSIIMSLIVIGIAVFLNMIANEYNWKKDLTKNQIHTLSEQSIKILKGLTSEVRLRAFINPTQMGEFENIFGKYTYYSKMLKKEYVDVDKDPFAVQKYQIKQTGTIVIESDARSVKIDNLAGPDDPKLEEKLTNAIIQVAKGDKKKLYFISGHGERLMADTGREGYSGIKETLENGRYKIEELVLLEKGSIPADAEIVLLAGPKSEIMDQEYKALENYLKQGGKLLVMVEPTSPASMKAFLAKYGANWKPKKAILETNSLQQLAGGNPLTPIVTKYDPSHEITKDAKQLSLFAVATPIEKEEKTPPKMNVISLMQTSPRSLEVEVVADKVKVDQAKDRKGPLSVAVAVTGNLEEEKPKEADANKKPEAEKPKTKDFRLVVVGDADFAANGVRQFGINNDLFQNMLAWLAHEEDLIAIRPKPTDTSEFEITEERSRVINLASVVVFPFAMFIAGIVTWLKRKRK